MELTNVTLEELELKLDEVQESIRIEKQRGPEKNDDQIRIWEKDEADILQAMDQVSRQEVTAKVETAHEERVQASVSSIASDLDSMEAGGIPIRQLFAGEGEYQLGRISLQRLMEDHESGLLTQIKGLEEQLLQEQRQNGYLQGRIKDADAKADQLTIELADTESKRDAAARELADANSKIDQLQSWNDDLQKQISLGTRGALRVIDPEEMARREAEEKAAADRLRIERFTVYGLVPDREFNPTKFTGKRAFDNEPCEIPAFALKGGAYTVLNDENEVSQFRKEHNIETESVAADDQNDQPLDQSETAYIPAVVPVQEEQFQQANQVEGTPASTPVAEMAGTEDKGVATRTEIEARFQRIEEHLGLISWQHDGEVA